MWPTHGHHLLPRDRGDYFIQHHLHFGISANPVLSKQSILDAVAAALLLPSAHSCSFVLFHSSCVTIMGTTPCFDSLFCTEPSLFLSFRGVRTVHFLVFTLILLFPFFSIQPLFYSLCNMKEKGSHCSSWFFSCDYLPYCFCSSKFLTKTSNAFST